MYGSYYIIRHCGVILDCFDYFIIDRKEAWEDDPKRLNYSISSTAPIMRCAYYAVKGLRLPRIRDAPKLE
jgi:hypothetical protein